MKLCWLHIPESLGHPKQKKKNQNQKDPNPSPQEKKDPHLDISFPRATVSLSEIKLAEENVREKVGANENCTRFFGFTHLDKKSIALGKQELVELEEMLPA